MMRRSLAALAAAASLAAAGCGNDAETDRRDTGSAKAVINMPDKFPSVAHKCYGKTGVYVTNNTTNGAGSVAVVTRDENCP